jgi:hypothetical protein
VTIPSVTANNKVSTAVSGLQVDLAKADALAKQCPNSPSVKAMSSTVNAVKAYLTTIGTASGSNPSILDVAIRKEQISDSGIQYLLYLQRDVSGGGTAAIKPSWFQSTRLVVGAADVITYRLVRYPEGKIALANLAIGEWTSSCGLSDWSSASCIKSEKIQYTVDGESVKLEGVKP